MRLVPVGFAVFMLVGAGGQALVGQGACTAAALTHERKDVATIARLETAWSVAFLQGDLAFERCLITPDFTEIMSTGEVKTFADELGFAAANIGKHPPIPVFPKPTVLLHGNAAVAYATVRSTSAGGLARTTRYADFYLWERGAWHAYFAQQTRVDGG